MIAKLRESLLVIILGVLALGIVINAVAGSDMLYDNDRNAFVSMLDGSAETPYVYRTLLPQIANLVAAITPQVVQNEITGDLSALIQTKEFGDLKQWEKKPDPNTYSEKYLYPVGIIILLMYVSLLAYGLILRALSKDFFPDHVYMPWGTAFLGVVALIPIIDFNVKLYDFPGLALSALALLYLQRQRWVSYFVCLLLATINKETTFLMIILFGLVHYQTMPRSLFIKLLVLQCALYIAVVGAIHMAYAGNSGVDFYFHPWKGVTMFFKDMQKPPHLIALVLLYALIVARWNEQPFLLRRSLWLLPIMAALYYVCGKLGEYRVFFDVFAYLTLIAGYTMFRPLQNIKERLCAS